MIAYPNIDPVAFHLGPFPVHWYGLMYLVGFFGSWSVLALRIKSSSVPRCLTVDALSDVLFYSALGIILGGRIGYMLFYDWNGLLVDPLSLFRIWEGGMSFHGGLIGVILAVWLYAYKHQLALFDVTDFITPAIPIGLAAGRIGNFINGELWGRVTNVQWAMIFPRGGDLPRHPSQLYEFLLEGLLLFIILWMFSRQQRARGAVSGLFLISYGLVRFCVEFFREPDIQMGFIAFGWLTKGQLLCLPMIVIGVGIMIWANRKGGARYGTVP